MAKRKADDSAPIAKKPKHWSLGLLSTLEDTDSIVKSDDLVNVIKDKYPKAKHHYLVLPREDLANLTAVTTQHLALLKHMEAVALDLVKEFKIPDFRIGYHAQPSMQRLHLHLVSNDLMSHCVKTKKHWNSYTTPFFLKSQDVCASLEAKGAVELPSAAACKKFLERTLKCHKCDFEAKNMPTLKTHLSKKCNK